MALSRVNRHQETSGVAHGTGAFTTTSFTPSNSTLLAVRAAGNAASDSGMRGTDLTISDSAGLTWTSRAATTAAIGWSYGDRIWTAPVTSGVSMTVSVDCGAFDIDHYRVEVYEYSGHDTGSPVGGTIVGSDADGNGAASITLSATPATTSEVLACAFTALSGAGTASITEGSGWTELFDTIEASWSNWQSQIRTGSASTTVAWVDLSVGTAGAVGAILLAVEIKEAAGGASISDVNLRGTNRGVAGGVMRGVG